jgi:probable HAF family extracellular repeat protein
MQTIRTIVTTLLLLLLATTQGWAKPVQQYTVTDLGPGVATDIDPVTDEVVGSRPITSEGGRQEGAWRLLPDLDLGPLPEGLFARANAIRAGRIVGNAGTGNFSLFNHAFLYEDGTLRDLGTLGAFNLFSTATSINSSRLICGYADTEDFTGIEILPVCWPNGPGQPQMLPTLGGPSGFINALNEAGDLCGRSETAAGDDHATCWFAGATEPVDLHGDIASGFGSAVGVNEAQTVVDHVTTDAGLGRAFVWTAATGMVTLPPLPGDHASDARGINTAGDIVGTSSHGSEELQRNVSRPVLYGKNDKPIDLTTRIDTDFDCELESAVGISDSGTIVVNGTCERDGRFGEWHVFLLTPVSGPVVDKPHKPIKPVKRLHKRERPPLPVEASGLGKMDETVLNHLRAVQPRLAAKIEAQLAQVQ